MLKRSTLILSIILTFGLLLAGCSNLPGAGAARDAAQTAACQAFGPLATAIGQIGELSATATAADAKALSAKLDGPLKPVRSIAGTLRITELELLIAAYDKLAALVNDLPDDAPLAQSAVDVQAAVAEMQTALGKARTALNCDQ